MGVFDKLVSEPQKLVARFAEGKLQGILEIGFYPARQVGVLGRGS